MDNCVGNAKAISIQKGANQMPRTFTIHKPTHKFYLDGCLLAVGQLRGDRLVLNMVNKEGKVFEKTWAVGTCAHHLTGCGHGVKQNEALALDSLQGAWAFTFGVDAPTPTQCNVVE